MLDAGCQILDTEGIQYPDIVGSVTVPTSSTGRGGGYGDPPYDIQYLETSIQHRPASSTRTFTPPTSRFEAELR